MSGLTPEMAAHLIDATAARVGERIDAADGSIGGTVDQFFEELGLDRNHWLAYHRARCTEMAMNFVEEYDGDETRLTMFLSACLAVSFTDGFLFGVEFVRAQREHMAGTS